MGSLHQPNELREASELWLLSEICRKLPQSSVEEVLGQAEFNLLLTPHVNGNT